MLELHHYSPTPISRVESRRVGVDPPSGYEKPPGFWVSVDEPDEEGQEWGWRAWCESEDFGLNTLKQRHRVSLADPKRLLWIRTLAELKQFDERYGTDDSYRRRAIEWERVAADWAGVIIAPYQWAARLEIDWYYSWDCASGVIWDASVIERVELETAESSPK